MGSHHLFELQIYNESVELSFLNNDANPRVDTLVELLNGLRVVKVDILHILRWLMRLIPCKPRLFVCTELNILSLRLVLNSDLMYMSHVGGSV